ncbi:MAG: hypothetical protein J1E95_04200 [Muribaculaceae bacterium]|nr:hypothetical protein [Muribaculaceae bacterium]
MDVKKLADVIGNYLAKYLPLTGGTVSGVLTVDNYIRLTSESGRKRIIAGNQNSNGVKNSCLIDFINGEIIFGNGDSYEINAALDMAMSINRNRIVVEKPIIFNSTVNGTSVASLVSLDDLRQVLSTDQIAKLEAKVQSRIALAKVSDTQSEMGGGG